LSISIFCACICLQIEQVGEGIVPSNQLRFIFRHLATDKSHESPRWMLFFRTLVASEPSINFLTLPTVTQPFPEKLTADFRNICFADRIFW
jgi:hypothetical protein